MNKYIINIKWNKFEYKFVDVFFNAIAKIQGFNSYIQQKLCLEHSQLSIQYQKN